MNKLQRYIALMTINNAGESIFDVCLNSDVCALEAENERLRAAMTAKIEPWMMQASNDIEDAYAIAIEKETYVTEPAALDIAAILIRLH